MVSAGETAPPACYTALMWNQLPIEERLRLQSDIDPDGCWTMRKIKMHGYAEIMFEGRRQRAHRVSFMIHKGDIPAGLMVCHTCNNPPCWRPEHLFLGTNKMNQDHAYATGLMKRGEDHPSAKLTQAQADDIRKLFGSGSYTKTQLSEMFNINRERVWRILKDEIYVG